MKKPFSGNYKLTQAFNDKCCRASYKKFGLMGHNGQDFGLPTGTEVLAPHNGKVIEATLDPKGYGLYVKIENSIEGSILAHNKELRVGAGDVVEEGQLVALSNNSGNSTGSHLHWGYYRIPRDRQNGYAGFIDQTPFLNPPIPSDILQRADAFVAVADKLQKPIDKDIVLADIDTLLKHEELIVDKDQTIEKKNTELAKIREETAEMSQKVERLGKENESLSRSLQELTEKARTQSSELEKLEQELEEFKNIQTIETASVFDLFSAFISRIFRGRR